MLVTKLVEYGRFGCIQFESDLRTLFTPDPDSWLASRLFINEEAIPEVEPYADLLANDSEVKGRRKLRRLLRLVHDTSESDTAKSQHR